MSLEDHLEDQLLPVTLKFAIHTFVETRLDIYGFEQKYRNEQTGRKTGRQILEENDTIP